MKLKDRLNYLLIEAIFYPLSHLPLRMLYVISDSLAWIGRVVVRYRRRTIRENLAGSFPGRSKKELRMIERKFYHWLMDYFMETIKLLSATPEWIERHMIVENPEVISQALSEGRNVSLFLGHYCNWEWVSSLPLYFPKTAECAQVYHPLHNKGMDAIFGKIRTRFGANNIPMKDILRSLIGWKRDGIPSVTGYIADQAPGYGQHLFINFLNHDTGVFTGPERITRFLKGEMWYCHMERPKRGYYRLRFMPVALDMKREPDFEPTRKCFAMLEKSIDAAPQYWLWSHRRWKHSRQDFLDYWGAEKAEEMLSHL